MATGSAFASEIRLLSAGAVKSGLAGLLDSFHRETGHTVKAAFATAPEIRRRVTDGETVDVLIAPPAVLDELSDAGKIKRADRVMLGRVGVGVAVRDGTPTLKIGTVDEFKQVVLNAESLVYNRASTGLYLDRLFDRLGMAGQVRAKSTRYPSGAAVLNHVIKGKGNEIGFGAITEIMQYSKQALKLVGPLPAEIQNYTTYVAMVVAGEAIADAALSLVRYITAPAAKAALAAAGIES